MLPNTTTAGGQDSFPNVIQRDQPNIKCIGSKEDQPRDGKTTSTYTCNQLKFTYTTTISRRSSQQRQTNQQQPDEQHTTKADDHNEDGADDDDIVYSLKLCLWG